MNPSEGAKQNIGTIHVVEPKTSTPKSINPYKVLKVKKLLYDCFFLCSDCDIIIQFLS